MEGDKRWLLIQNLLEVTNWEGITIDMLQEIDDINQLLSCKI